MNGFLILFVFFSVFVVSCNSAMLIISITECAERGIMSHEELI